MSDEQLSFLEEEGDLGAVEFTSTRQAGLSRLDLFTPYSGGTYASGRNFDLGPDRRSNVSALSPWVRHRLISEEAILGETLKQHSLRTAEKFIQEVFWRSYFKGWLEQRPDVWYWYRKDLKSAIKQLEKDGSLNQRYAEAIGGETGIDAFDFWAKELVETGYLHNHARMWFASIWIFTLKLPWELGADFFYRHLMDGDPASNTCSWRWVGGLHTKGKNYAARASNIAKFTQGRFTGHMGLATNPMPLDETREARLIPPPQMQSISDMLGDEDFTLLITQEDCLPETLNLSQKPTHVVGLLDTNNRSPLNMGEKAAGFTKGALHDALERAGKYFECETKMLTGDNGSEMILDYAKANDLKTIVTAYAPVGPTAKILSKAKHDLAEHDIRLLQILRDYDAMTWPHATKGFFKLKKKILEFLNALEIS